MAIFRYTWRSFSRELLFIVAALAFCLPFYLLVTISLKTTSDAYTAPMKFPGDPQYSNFETAWSSGMGAGLLSSFIITVGSVLCVIAIGSLTAYVIARHRSRLSVGLYLIFVLGIIIPSQLAVIPLYVALRQVGLASSYLGMIILYTGLLMPLTVFLYTGFIRSLPIEYEEAAQVDGAGVMRTYFRVVFPLLRPITGTVAVLAGLIVWNDFFIQLVFLTGTPKETLPVAIYSFVSNGVEQWNLIFAAVAISIAPMLLFFVFAQRQLVRGFTSGIRG